MKAVIDKVLKKIKPTPTEIKKFRRITTQFLKKLAKIKDTKAVLGGSGEKNTWLSNSHDIDIFVLFDSKKHLETNLSDYLEEHLKKLFPKIQRLHGSRDYFQINYQSYLFEVVPILKITKSKEAQNITDISPLHAQWVKKHKKLADDIRLAKQFTKAVNCYGAESYITGFSGYVMEILTIYYQSFENLITAAAQWENRDIIDVEKHYKTRLDVFKDINKSKLQSPLIIIDPVDKNRNAAAALSMEKFLLFKRKAQEFLDNPHVKNFEKQKLDFNTLEKTTRYNLVYLELTPLIGKIDVIGTKLLKVFQYFQQKLPEFGLLEDGWDWNLENKAQFYFILEKRTIDPFVIKQGPPLKMEEAVKNFQKKNKNTVFEKNKRLFAKIPFKHNNLQDFIKETLKDNYIKERIKAVKIVKFG